MKKSGFKMKNPSIAKLAKAAGSPMRKDLPSYDEAFDKMETTTGKGGKKYKVNKLADKMYVDSDVGRQLFKEEAKLYNAKQKNKNVAKVEPKKPTDAKKTMKTVAEPKTKKKRKSVTSRLRERASKFGRMGT